MSEREMPAAPVRSEEERAAFFDELMREERRGGPFNGFAIATLVFGLLGGLLAPVFAIVALIQIRERRQRGMALVVAGLVAFVIWVVVEISWFTSIVGAQPAPVNGYDLKVGDCFQAPGASGEDSVARLSCTDWHTGEAFAAFTLPDGTYPGAVELYDTTLARCDDLAAADPAVAGQTNGRVQVMTLAPDTWAKRKSHRIVCYVRFANQVDHPL